MKILITGITGRIGAALARTFIEAGHEVRGLVWAQDQQLAQLEGLPIDLIEGSLVNADDVNRATDNVEAICHLGAAFQAGGPFSNNDYFEINVRGTFNVLEAARLLGSRLQHLFFASSDALYKKYIPGGMRNPICEDTAEIAPNGPYALTKGLGESMCLGYHRTYGLPITVFRFALTMADDEILNFRQFQLSYWQQVYANRVGDDVDHVRQQLQKFDDGQDRLLIARDGQGRSYKKHIADVQDIVQGFTCALGNQDAFGEIFQLGGPSAFTWEEIIPYLADKLNMTFIDVVLTGHIPTYYEFDLSKAKKLIGFSPQVDVYQMIDNAIANRKS